MDYPDYLNRMIVEIADRQSRDKIRAVALRPIHDEIFPDEARSWLESLASELHRQGLGADWQATDNLSFTPNGALFHRAAEIRNDLAEDKKASSVAIDWGKWGTIFTAFGLLLAIVLWWFS